MSTAFPKPGEWACYRGNRTLDARAQIKGAITQPAVAWKQFVGAIDTWLVAEPDAQHETLKVPGDPVTSGISATADPRWGLTPPQGEIAGRVQPISQTATVTYARVLPDTPGLQKLEFESAFSKPTTNGDWAHDCVGRCFAWRNDAWVQVWQSAPIDMLFSPYPIVGDFDADGAQEVAILPWKSLLILDARTGRIKAQCRFTEGRSYGFFGVYDLDGDGKSEFVIQADFAKHVDVLGYRDGKLTLLWQREIEMDISDPQKVLHVPPRPVGDVDGDGKQEVLVNLFNGTGDGRWRLTIHDGLTGTVRAELSEEYLAGVADVDGDGVTELLTVHCAGAGVPDYGRVGVWNLKGGKPVTLWQREETGWQMGTPPLPLNVNSGATLGNRDILHRLHEKRAQVVLRQRAKSRTEQTLLTVATWAEGGFQPGMTLQGTQIEAVALDATSALLARCLTPPRKQATATVRSGRLRALGSAQRGVPLTTPVVVWDQNATRPTVLVQGATGQEELVAFHPPQGHRSGVEWRRISGRGTGFDWPGPQLGPVIADLRGEGQRQHLYATAAPDGSARLVAADLSGREVWHHDFATIPGTPPIWNTGGIVWWQAGHFTDRQRQDVLVTVRRSMMHSEETVLLSGVEGRTLWHRQRQVAASNRGVGGTPFAIADYDGDGLDDVACLHPSNFYILKGSTGQNLISKEATWDKVPAKPVYWGIPIAGDFEGRGKPDIFFGTNRRSMTGLIRADGSLAWWDALDVSPTCLPAFGDFDGDGRIEALGIGYPDGIRCYDTATGHIRWRMPNPAPHDPLETASADINGDGREEALFVVANTLYCVGASGPSAQAQGTLLWKLELPAPVGPPVIADLEGQGRAAILLVGSDGYVYCVR
jgi:outer membrane protein assembly factor BamB